MSYRRCIAAALFLALALCFGCAAGARKSSGEEDLLPMADREFADVPAPIGFSLQNAYSFDLPPSRMFLLEYGGKAPIAKVKRFYKDQMPRQGWSLTCESTFGKVIFLDFVKEGERCMVKLEDENGKVRVTLRSHR